jgi:hypothetical protein
VYGGLIWMWSPATQQIKVAPSTANPSTGRSEQVVNAHLWQLDGHRLGGRALRPARDHSGGWAQDTPR